MDAQEFKFHFLADGKVTSVRTKKGRLDDATLTLDAEVIPLAEIVDLLVRDNRMLVTAHKREPLTLQVYKVKARDLEQQIARRSSALRAEQNKRELEKAGEGSKFRAVICPVCAATINLSGLDRSSYVHCRYCESLLDRDSQVVHRGDRYRVCDECAMFDRVKGYTEFYFYFLVVVYGFSSKRRHVCDRCAGRIFIKTLLINLIFILGIIPSIVIKIRSLIGREQAFKKLPAANALAIKGRYAQADPMYLELMQAHPAHPGLLLNQAVGHLNGRDTDQGVALLRQSLRSCANYRPALQLVAALKQAASGSAEPAAAKG
jgi:hypothetical protein